MLPYRSGTPLLPNNVAKQIGEQLYALRYSTGMSQAELADAIDIDSTKVSRAENGRRLLAADEVRRWVKATGGPRSTAETLINQIVASQVKNPTWSDETASGQNNVQRSYAAMAESSEWIVYVDPWIVPGPIQTPDYARAVITMSEKMWRKGKANKVTVEQAVRHRVGIASLFADSTKRFEFITSTVPLESIHYLPAPKMVVQVHALLRAIDMGVYIGIIPPGQVKSIVPAGFQIFDDQVRSDTAGELIRRSDADRLKAYRRQLKAVKALCVSGDEAAQLLTEVAKRLRSQT